MGAPPCEGASMWGRLGLLVEWELCAQVEAWRFPDSPNKHASKPLLSRARAREGASTHRAGMHPRGERVVITSDSLSSPHSQQPHLSWSPCMWGGLCSKSFVGTSHVSIWAPLSSSVQRQGSPKCSSNTHRPLGSEEKGGSSLAVVCRAPEAAVPAPGLHPPGHSLSPS